MRNTMLLVGLLAGGLFGAAVADEAKDQAAVATITLLKGTQFKSVSESLE
jgi:hypothetical protein